MQCPSCQHPESRVLESRPTEAGKSIRRRRECLHCQCRFTTYERVEVAPLAVVKRNGKREDFDREKLRRGLALACEKTSVATERLEAIAAEIEASLQGRGEVTSTEIGALVLGILQQESEVAYVRFASVYQKFQRLQDFTETLERLKQGPERPPHPLRAKSGFMLD